MQVCSTMKVIVLLLVTCELCCTIRVPVSWDEGESEAKNTESDGDVSVESFQSQESVKITKPQEPEQAFRPQNEKSIPVEYFEYTAKKPQFAVDIAAFHGVQSPENHYKAYPIRPHTGRLKPELGKHHILDNSNTLHKPLQDYTKINKDVRYANPVSTSYEVFHPYEAETPALQEIYKDPVFMKIRNDLENSKSRLQQYEKDAGKPNISSDEYLESPQKTDGKLFPHRHRPAPFEIHRPQRRPVYYKPVPVYKSHEQYLNQKLRHPWNHNIAKVRPIHYRPIQNHIHRLRQSHALKYDDERNEYPQVQIHENYADPADGLDIYERGKDKFVQLRNNVDESINNAAKQNRPAKYEKLEAQNNESTSSEGEDDDDEEEFIPITNYAQVRKTETFKHLPRSAALEDAVTYDEIKNSPRLREAVKSTKAQTVYSEEGYEDAAYDHAGEQKHASENEAHGGFLKENELSGGKYKAPTLSANYEDGGGSVYRDKIIHAENWKDDNKDTKEETDEEDNTEEEHESLLEADNHQTEPQDEDNQRNKRENSIKNETTLISDNQNNNTKHEVDKRQVNFEIPQIDLNSTFLKDSEFNDSNTLKVEKQQVVPKKDTIKQKYPYYFKNIKAISKNSPLRYAENLKLIPKKSKGGTEFYDSRSKFECPEVDDVPDPIPDKLKGDGHPDESDDDEEIPSPNKGDENFDTTKKQPRLKGLGDKINCYKAKFFGENPLDSPFFKEDIISNPEPVFLPNIAAYQLKAPFLLKHKEEKAAESKTYNDFVNLHENNTYDLFGLIEKLRSEQNLLRDSIVNPKNGSIVSTTLPSNQSYLNNSQLADQSIIYNDVIKNIKNSLLNGTTQKHFNNISQVSNISNQSEPVNNITYTHFQSKEDITKSPLSRKKRATMFVYEPYKIIRDTQIQDDLKKSAITGNVSPLIKQLQSSKVIETVGNPSSKDTQHAKRNVNSRAYKDIGVKDREIKYGSSKNEKSYEDSEIIDVNTDTRRGEPRYEIKHENHKTRYTPVLNAKSMKKRDYERQINNDKPPNANTRGESASLKSVRQRKPTEKSHSDASKAVPQTTEEQSTTASYTTKGAVFKATSTVKPHNSSEQDKDSGSDEDYEEYDEDEEEDDEEGTTITTTTSTTPRPAFRRKTRPQTTTEEPLGFIEQPRLELVTRFRDYKPRGNQENEHISEQRERYRSKKPTEKTIEVLDDESEPKFREKKKKVTKSTLVTDTKRYGNVDDEDKMMKDEVDAMIGVNYDSDDYLPHYEKDEENKSKEKTLKESENEESREDTDDDDELDEDDEDDHIAEDDEEDEDEDDYDADSAEDENDHTIDDEAVNTEKELKVTTPEPTKRTLVITTDAPIPTVASRSAKIQARPIITKKKIEIHKELPVNRSSPHVSQYKQDIKEIEIIKETRNPLRRKPNKNVEVLDLYKDDDLAKDINKLGVEIFKENLDLRQGPKHGGNYRSIESSTSSPSHEKTKDDAETSQSVYKKKIEFDDGTLNGNDAKRAQKPRSRGKNSEQIELIDNPKTGMHGGNFKYQGRSRNNNAKSEKLFELVEDEHDDESTNDSDEVHSYRNSRRPMHGGNYRSAKLIEEKPSTEPIETESKETVRNAALVLNSFVQAAPVLVSTTKPTYILDPSQRKYYYVDI